MNARVKGRATTLTLAAVILSGASSASAAPPGPPPTVPGVKSAPPPAWIQTRSGDRWLAFSDFCWTFTCADSRPLAQRKDIPRIRVKRGEVVGFHLRFQPTKLAVELGAKTYPLKTERVVSWRVLGTSGFVTLHARKGGFRAEYVARLIVA
jgi:hypothetical protein